MADDSLDIDKLTDFEILDKLKDLGWAVGKETKVTRKALSIKLKRLLRAQPSRRASPTKRGNPSSMQYSSGEETQPEELPTPTKTLSRKKISQVPQQDLSPASHQRGSTFSGPSTSLGFGGTSKPQNTVVSNERRLSFEFSESDSDIDVESHQDVSQNIYESPQVSAPPFIRNHEPNEFDKRMTRSRTKESNRVPPTRDTGQQRRCDEHEANIDKDMGHHNYTSKYTCPPLYQNLLQKNLTQAGRQRKNDKAHILVHSITVIGLMGIVYYVFSQASSEHDQIAAFHSDNNYYPICGQENVDSSVCVEDVQLMPALDLANILVPKLREDAVEAYCNPATYAQPVAIPSMNEEDALAYLKTKLPSRKPAQLQKDLKNFKILLLANPHWELKVVANGMNDIEKILFYGEIAAKQFTLPFTCYVCRIFFKIPSVILLTVSVTIIAGMCSVGYRIYLRVSEAHKRNIYRIVHNILQAVYEQKRDVNAPDYISIETCRDLVLSLEPEPITARDWEEAVAFIKKYETRIRTEVRNVRGELVKVWLWVPPPIVPNFTA